MNKLNLDFKQYNKKEWLEIIEKSLKKGSIDDFKWELGSDVFGEPFAHKDDIDKKHLPFESLNNNWIQGIDYSLIDNDVVNDYIKQHINFGLQSAIINVNSSNLDFSVLLKGVDLNSINLIFNTRYGVDLILFMESFKDYLIENGYNNKKCKVTLRLPVNRPSYISELYQYCTINFPEINFYFKTERAFSKNPVQYLIETFNSISDFIEKSEINKEHVNWLLSRLKVHFFLNADLLSDIAVLRAFKTLWYNYIKAYRLDSIDPKIILGINHDSYTENENNDMIMATVLCMSGAISGVESILIAPKEQITDTKNTMRLMLNIQNIMKLESNMSSVNDALAGSYSLESATERIAKKAWEEFE